MSRIDNSIIQENVQQITGAAEDIIVKDIIPWIRDFKFIFIFLLTIILVVIIIKWAKKHMPSKGRIIDVYDQAGNKKEKHSKKDDKITNPYEKYLK